MTPLPTIRFSRVLVAVLAIVAVVFLGVFCLVGIAFGLGKVLVRVLPFSPFESTLLALVGLVVVGNQVASLIGAFFKFLSVTPDPAVPPSDPEGPTSDTPSIPTVVFEPSPHRRAPRSRRR